MRLWYWSLFSSYIGRRQLAVKCFFERCFAPFRLQPSVFLCSQTPKKFLNLAEARGLNADFRSVALRFDEAKRCFELDVEALAEALGPQTAALIVNTPLGWPSVEVVSIDL